MSADARDVSPTVGRRSLEGAPTAANEIIIGVDVGGTTTAAGAVALDGDVRLEERAPTHGAGSGTALETVVALVDTVRRRAAGQGLVASAIGVGVPGVVDAARGTIGDEAPHVPELAGVDLARALRQRFGLPVFVDNDVNALALGELRFGLGRGAQSLVVLAAGTGFGTGIVLNGRLVRGAHGFGGEFGHAPVKFDGRPCWCGGRGCLAVYSSGRGIAEAACERVAGRPRAPLLELAGGDPRGITAALVFQAADAGDALAEAVVDEACRALGAMIGVIVNGLDPEVVVVTGGVAVSYVTREKKILAAAAAHAFKRALAQTRVRIVPGDKRVTIRGPAALVLHERKEERA